MIRAVMIFNIHGKPRLAKFYQEALDEARQQELIRKICRQVTQRPDSFCNYLEGCAPEWGEGARIIYRHYATLYFVFVVDAQESELGILDLIQVFVETLDKCFDNVCELDMVFHSDKVHYILDEIVMGGMVLETHINHILNAINDQNRLHSNSLGSGPGGAAGGAAQTPSPMDIMTSSIFSTISSSLTSKR